MTDRDLIDATRRGERGAFGQLVARYQRLVEAAAFCATSRQDLVDDIVQDTFITAWRTIDTLRDAASLRSWLYGIARNLGLKARRTHGRLQPLEAAADIGGERSPLDALVQRERDHEIAAALGRLPARYREPLVLFYYEHCTVKEVATTLAMQEAAAMQRLSRGRRKLGEALACRVEAVLESKPTRAALVGSLLLLLPARTATAAPLAADVPVTAAGTASSWTAIGAWLAGSWRFVGAALGSAAALGVVVAATVHSNEVAARSHGRAAAESIVQPAAPAAPPPTLPPSLEPTFDDPDHIYRVINIATLDPVESCARGARGVVLAALGKHALRVEGDVRYYEPSDDLLRVAREAGERAASTCGGDTWPEVYVICEGTLADIEGGTITCYPYDVFAGT